MPSVMEKRMSAPEALLERLHRAIATHFDPTTGSRFWLERAALGGLDGRRDIRCLADLERLGEVTPADLRSRPLTHFIPRVFHDRMDQFIIGQTGGTTGTGTWTAYREDEFEEAFIIPFVSAAAQLSFPAEESWLFIGPSGPHIIGKVVRHLANALGSADPFSVDFDPRWARKLPEASFARRRYLQHVVEQSLEVIASQEIGVLFTTPVVLAALAQVMSDAQRERIRGVHYGGMAVACEELARFQSEVFPNAVHISGYGNTLFGCCLELSTAPGRELEYFPYGHRLLLETVDGDGATLTAGGKGRVRFTRIDESFLIVRLAERDQGVSITPPSGAPDGFELPGIRNPGPLENAATTISIGLY